MSFGEFSTMRDYTHGTAPRVMGSETEINSNLLDDKIIPQLITDGDKPRKLIDSVPPIYRVSHGRSETKSAVLSTGGELYIDTMLGNNNELLFESTTAECLTPQELRIHEHANLHILVETLNSLAKTVGQPTPEIYKRSGYVDVYSPKTNEQLLRKMSLGHHENYYTKNKFTKRIGMYGIADAFPDRRKETRGLSTMLVLRKLIDGAGMVAEGHYSISQKPDAFVFSSKAQQKTMDDESEEEYVQHGTKVPARCRKDRIEIRTGEGNKSDWVIEQKFALTSLLLRYLDHMSYPNDFILARPDKALKDISRDPWADVQLENGLIIPAPALFHKIIHRAQEMAEKKGELPEYEVAAVEEFDKFYKDLQKVSFEDNVVGPLANRVDWAARLQHLYDLGAKHEDIKASKMEYVAFDLEWDRISGEDIARQHFSKFGHAALDIVIPEPPKNRAEWRVKVAKDLYSKGTLKKVHWHAIEATDKKLSQKLENPFMIDIQRQ